MNIHKYSSFRNSCVYPPRNPTNRQPSPQFERHFREGQSQGPDLPNQDDEVSMKNLKFNLCEEIERENETFRTLANFYDSIPDYSEINHLPENEFYTQLERLKLQQSEIIDKPSNIRDECIPCSSRSPKTFNKNEVLCKAEEVLSDSSDSSNSIDRIEKTARERPSSTKTKKSVRINSGTTFRTENNSDCDEDFVEDKLNFRLQNLRSKSASPFRCKKLTVPKPFKMTQREEEEKMLEDFIMSSSSLCFNEEEVKKPKTKSFKANPVPLTSRIPLLNHIQEEQKRKSDLAKLNSSIELQSQMKPFQFAESSSRPHSRCLSRSTSTPHLDPKPTTPFKANPCPKNLFSSYFYNKMWEDEYFRVLNRKIRAEEMLKISSLPPSMAKRNKEIIPDWESFGFSHFGKSKSKRKKRKLKKTTNSVSEDMKSNEGSEKKNRKKKPLLKVNSLPLSNSSVSVTSSCRSSPMPIYPVNRPNLAATLRVETSRNKVKELAQPKLIVPPTKVSAPSRSRELWGVRKSPAWKSIYYDGTNTEDIAIRLETRRAEQRLRQEEHRISMELMKQRVRAAPLLLEGPTYWGPKVGQLTHRCKSATDLDRRSRYDKHNSHGSRNTSKLSFYSDSKCSKLKH